MIRKIIDEHLRSHIPKHLEPVRLSFTHVSKDITRLDQFSRESRDLMERWNQYFLSVIKHLQTQSHEHTVLEHAKRVPILASEVSQLHSAHTSLYKSLQRQQEMFDSVKQDISVLQQSMTKIVGQYNNCLLTLFEEVRAVKKQVSRPAEEQEFEEKKVQHVHSHKESEAKAAKTLQQIAGTLTTSERAILLILVSTEQKLSYKDISVSYGRSPSTIKNIICRLKSKNIPLLEDTSTDGEKRYYLDDNFRRILTSRG